MTPQEMRKLARLGAMKQMEAISAERKALLSAFPDIDSKPPPRKRKHWMPDPKNRKRMLQAVAKMRAALARKR